jgi:hypothetical protein
MNELVPTEFYTQDRHSLSLEYMILGLRIKYPELNKSMSKYTKGKGTDFVAITDYNILYTAIFDKSGLLIAFHPNRWAKFRDGRFLSVEEENTIDAKVELSKKTEFKEI